MKMESKCITGIIEFSDKELDDEIKLLQEEIDHISSYLRRLYGHLQLVKNEKEKKNEKI